MPISYRSNPVPAQPKASGGGLAGISAPPITKIPNTDPSFLHAALTDALVKLLHWPHYPWPPISGDTRDTMPDGLSPEIQGCWQTSRAIAVGKRHHCEGLSLKELLKYAREQQVIGKLRRIDQCGPGKAKGKFDLDLALADAPAVAAATLACINGDRLAKAARNAIGLTAKRGGKTRRQRRIVENVREFMGRVA